MHVELGVMGASEEVLRRDQKKAAERRREQEVIRHETELRRAFLATPGATEEAWETERETILADDRRAQAVKNKDAASRSQASIYRTF